MTNPLFDYSPIVRREPLQLPDGKKLAVWVALCAEHYQWGAPALSLAPFTAQLVPDPLNYGWRDYGPRVGIWRLAEIVERLGIPATCILNSEVCERNPEVVEEGAKRGWAFVAHGTNNSTWQTGMEPGEDRRVKTRPGHAQLNQSHRKHRPNSPVIERISGIDGMTSQ